MQATLSLKAFAFRFLVGFPPSTYEIPIFFHMRRWPVSVTYNGNTPVAAISIRARDWPLQMPIKIISFSYVKELNSEKGGTDH